jgi:hypothetical protein
MSRCGRPRPGLWARITRWLGLRRDDWIPYGDSFEEPPDAFVREPRRPRPAAPAGTIMLELPDSE